MIYKVILSSGKEPIQINTDEELAKVVACIQRGDKIVVCKNGIFNPSFLVEIMPDQESYSGHFHYLRSKEDIEAKHRELANEPSPFAKALSGNKGIGAPADDKPSNYLN